MNNEESAKDFFNKRALTYDRDYMGKFTQRYKQMLLEVIGETRNVEPGCPVLDVACGTGTLLKMLYDKYSIAAYGIDISENMINKAKEKNKNFRFDVGSASDLHIANDNSIEVVTVSAAYHHFRDTDLFLREAYRVLKPGGSIYIAEIRLPGLLRLLANFFAGSRFNRSGGEKMYSTNEINESFAKNSFVPQPSRVKNFIQICYAIKPV